MLDNDPMNVAMETDDREGEGSSHSGPSTSPGTPPPDSEVLFDPLVAPLPVLSPINSLDFAGSCPALEKRQSLRSNASITSLGKRPSLKSSRSGASLTKRVSLGEKQASVTSDKHLSSSLSRGSSLRSQKSTTPMPSRQSSLRSNASVTSLRKTLSSSSNGPLSRRSSLRSQPSEVQTGAESRHEKVTDAEDPATDPCPESEQNAEENMETDNVEAPATEGTSGGDAPPVYMGPPPIEIAISFDTTGSMSPCIEQVQAQVGHMIERLFMDIPNLKIAVIAHGDYCDAEHFYVTQKVDFTNDLPTLSKFVKEVTGTGGGDWEECYELVLQMARTELNWSPGTQRSLVMIGDAAPHPFGLMSRNIDWREESDRLYKELGVSVYGVQCLSETMATPFWEELAKRTNGKHLKLDQFGTIIDMIMAIVYREHGPAYFEAYEREVRNREGRGIRNELDDMFSILRNGNEAAGSSGMMLPSARFGKGAAKRGPKKTANPRPKVSKARKVAATPAAGPSGASVVKQAKKKATTLTVKERKEAKKAGKANVAAKKKETKKAKANNAKRQFRETVPASKFCLKSLTWSPWKLAMSAQPPEDNKDAWEPRRSGRPGFRNVRLFEDHKSRPAVFEVAVQTGPRRKMHVVYCRTTTCIPDSFRWDRRILNRTAVRIQIDKVLQQTGCNVYVRRSFLPKTASSGPMSWQTVRDMYSGLLKKHYDYAWRRSAGRSTSFRHLVKNGCTISDGTVENRDNTIPSF